MSIKDDDHGDDGSRDRDDLALCTYIVKILLVTKMDIPDVDLTDVLDDDLAQCCGSSGPVDLFNWGLYSGDLHNRSNGIVF